jgi:LPXTG-motif cell wall-anchored protein
MITKARGACPEPATRWGCGVFGTKTLRRGAALVVVAAVLAMPIGMSPANAEPDYPPKFDKITASSFSAKVGQSVTLTAQTYRAGSAVAVDVSVDGASVGSSGASADGKGVATTSVTFTVAGVNRVTMSGTSDTGEDLALSADITVTEAGEDVVPVAEGSGGNGSDDANAGDDAAGGVPFIGGGLPRTGGEIAGTLLVAAALIGAGFLLVVATRRRRASH